MMLEVFISNRPQTIVGVRHHLSHHRVGSGIVETAQQHEGPIFHVTVRMSTNCLSESRHCLSDGRPPNCPRCACSRLVIQFSEVIDSRLKAGLRDGLWCWWFLGGRQGSTTEEGQETEDADRKS